MIYDNFRVDGAHDTALDYEICSHLLFVMMMFRNLIRDGMSFSSSMTKIPPDDVLTSLY